MKKIVTIAAFILSGCELPTEQIRAHGTKTVYDNPLYGYDEKVINHMTYGMWYVNNQSSQTGYSIFVINITKDSLEYQKLKMELKGK